MCVQVGAYDYAGCLSVPRILWAEPSTVAAEPSSSSSNQSSAEPSRWALHQQPVPELSRLRKTDAASCWRLSDDLPGESAELIILGSARVRGGASYKEEEESRMSQSMRTVLTCLA